MSNLKELAPHIRRIAVVNILLIVYFFSPSFLSFVAILAAVLAVFFENPFESAKTLFNHQEKCCVLNCTNQSFEKFRKLSIVEQLLLLVSIKLATDFTWLLPTWLLIFVAAEIFAVSGLLKQFGVTDELKKHVKTAKVTLRKGIAFIPKYDPTEN